MDDLGKIIGVIRQKVYHWRNAHPATALLVGLAILSLLVTVTNYLVQLLSWVLHYLNIVTKILFVLTYPAAVFSLISLLSLNFYPLQLKHWFATLHPDIALGIKVFLCVIGGQLVLICLPPLVGRLAVPFASHSLILLTLVVIPLSLLYAIYYFVTADTPTAVHTRAIVTRIYYGMDEQAEENVCVVCLVNPKMIIMKPCKHLCACTDCAPRLEECPVCRRLIEAYERIYPT